MSKQMQFIIVLITILHLKSVQSSNDQNFCDFFNQPCKNGGICISNINGFTCNCTQEWAGSSCSTPKSFVDRLNNNNNNDIPGGGGGGGGSINIGATSNNNNPNGININTGRDSFGSKQTYYNNNPCLLNPCYNNGRCQPNILKSPNAYVCACSNNFYGDRCEFFFGRKRNFLLSSVLPFLIVVSLIGISIYCFCYKRRLAAQNNFNVNRSNQGFMGQIMSFPTAMFSTRQPKPTVVYTATPTVMPPYPAATAIQDPEIAFRVNGNNAPPPPYASLYMPEQRP